jgi:hypothetical protein
MAFDPKTYVSNRVYSGSRALLQGRVDALRASYWRQVTAEEVARIEALVRPEFESGDWVTVDGE